MTLSTKFDAALNLHINNNQNELIPVTIRLKEHSSNEDLIALQKAGIENAVKEKTIQIGEVSLDQLYKINELPNVLSISLVQSLNPTKAIKPK